MSDVIHLSKATHERLTAEHGDLTTRGRIDIAQIIERARELGDLSENGDYHAAKDFQGMMEARIRTVHTILAKAVVVEDAKDGVAGPGTIVTIVYEGDDDDMAETYLVGHMEERVEGVVGHEIVSPGSPMGQALLGALTGQTVSYQAPGGQLRVKVLDVKKV